MLRSLILIVALSVSGLLDKSFAQDLKYEDVSKAQFEELIEDTTGLLIDLRTPKEYKEGHIEGSVNIDYFAENFEEEIDKLDTNRTMYIYCASGGRSGLTLELMKEKGFKTVYHLPVGYDGWIR